MKKALLGLGRSLSVGFIFVAVSTLGNLPSAAGVELFWSADTITAGGGLTGATAWNTTNAHWSTSASGPFTTVWNNANVDSATFQGTSGTVALNGGLTSSP